LEIQKKIKRQPNILHLNIIEKKTKMYKIYCFEMCSSLKTCLYYRIIEKKEKKMKNERELISQTNKTILFAHINSEKDDLLTMLAQDPSEKDSLVNSVNKSLTVKSFDEFLEKFSPTIYYSYDEDLKISYVTQKDKDSGLSEININKNHDAIKMLCKLIDSKKNLGQLNVDYDYDEIMEELTPEKKVDYFKKIRKEGVYLTEKYNTLDDGVEEKEELREKLNKIIHSIREDYQKIPALLTMAIYDIETLGKDDSNLSDSEENSSKKPCLLSLDENGDLKTIPVKDQILSTQASEQIEQSKTEDFGDYVIKDYEKESERLKLPEESREGTKGLLSRIFSSGKIQKENELNEESKARHDSYLDIIKGERDSFFKAAEPLLRTILGVKLFFDQFREGNNKNYDAPELLITNCRASDFSSKDGEKRLKKFLEELNTKVQSDNIIWFGIIPDVSSISTPDDSIPPSNPTPFDNDKEKKPSKKQVCNNGNLSDLASVGKILADYKITTFFNIAPSKENSFSGIASLENFKEGVISKVETLESLEEKHARYLVNCLPNFTIVPKGKKVFLGKKYQEDEESYFQLPGIYLDASFIACGLATAWQSPAFLKSRFGENMVCSYHGVRFDVEKDNNYLKTYSSLPREITGFKKRIKDQIDEAQYGFIFSSDKYAADETTPKNRITIYKARTMAKNEGGGYKEVFTSLHTAYIERYINAKTGGKNTSEKIKEIIGNSDSSVVNQTWKKHDKKVNGLVQKEDSISFENKEIKINYERSSETISIKIIDN
jgi:hypothetical protein